MILACFFDGYVFFLAELSISSPQRGIHANSYPNWSTKPCLNHTKIRIKRVKKLLKKGSQTLKNHAKILQELSQNIPKTTPKKLLTK